MLNRRENLTTRLSKMPMVMVLVPFALGIFFAEEVLLPLWVVLLGAILSVVGIALLERWWQRVALVLSLLFVGVLLHSLSFEGKVLYNEPLDVALELNSTSVEREGYTSATATIEECEESSLVGRRVVLWGDSLIHFTAGDRVALRTVIRPFRAERRSYAELMHHRGYVGAISVSHRANFEYIPAPRATLHDWAVERLRGAMEEGDARAVVVAMTTGERGEISSDLRQHYSASGTSHLLAVSGLHIGIAFMLINFLLFPLVLLRYGNLWRSLLAVVLIWLYVWLCGLSPSAVRAALMFSLLQISLSSLREYVSLNILAATAFVMLVLDSHQLFDISFQLSFIAVAGIVLWGMPIYRRCATRSKVVNGVLGILLVGVASTLATMPLVANTFSTISLVGILINPVVILLANIIVLFGVSALALPPLAVVAEGSATLQNWVVEWAASLRYGHFDFALSDATMWVVYGVFAVVTIALYLRPRREKEAKIEI